MNYEVHVAERFQRAIRIDSDIGSDSALEGFVCPESSRHTLLRTAQNVSKTGQGAFTWTGPFGSGKSSLVVAFHALLCGNAKQRRLAADAIGEDTSAELLRHLPRKRSGWRSISVVGSNEDPVSAILDAVRASGLSADTNVRSEKKVVSLLEGIAAKDEKTTGGLILFVDEMGKFLENAAHRRSDIYFFQLLAESASRSGGRFVVIGILHQSFEEYASRLSRTARDEWTKIQGRFIDLPVNAAGEEQLEVIGRAIETNRGENTVGHATIAIASTIKANKPGTSVGIDEVLERCWPLHPLTACLLGPISKRRFGQNQRSIFGFLNSFEINGFREYLLEKNFEEMYCPDRLWDYLKGNLEPTILASPDGHRWSTAVDAIERCESQGGDLLHLKLLKVISLVDMFKMETGLVANEDVLSFSLGDGKKSKIKAAIKDLLKWSLVIYKKYLGGYSIYAGSDFNIEEAIERELDQGGDPDFSEVKVLASLHPVLAKRHYHETGALRWYDIEVAALGSVGNVVADYEPFRSSVGKFILAVPTDGEDKDTAEKLCREASREAKKNSDVAIGISSHSWQITELVRELVALERVSANNHELAGDEIARREIKARVALLSNQLEVELDSALNSAQWFLKNHAPKRLLRSELSAWASDLVDKAFFKSPYISNELLNRDKPSSNAIAAQNALLRLMVLKEGEPTLGIDGYPAERGLLESVLISTKLYTESEKGWSFCAPKPGKGDAYRLNPIWEAATTFLQENSDRSVQVSEIFELWSQPPYGVKNGLLPILGVAYILSMQDQVAFYRLGIFQAQFIDLDVEYLARDAGDIQLRWMDLTEKSRNLLSSMAEVIREFDQSNPLTDMQPIDVARGLVFIFESLHPWTKRTMKVSKTAVQIRGMFIKAKDPNEVLFNDVPKLAGENTKPNTESALASIQEKLSGVLNELTNAYLDMLHRLRDQMFAELQVPNSSKQAIEELRDRALNIKNVSGDFRLNAFVSRLATLEPTNESIEGVVSLAASKPTSGWNDSDVDKAALELTELSQQFIKLESFARVKGRADNRQSMAVVVGLNGRPTPVSEDFDLRASDREEVAELIEKLNRVVLSQSVSNKNVLLAALAELSARYILQENEAINESDPEALAT